MYNISREMKAYNPSRPSPLEKLMARNTQYATAKLVSPNARKSTRFFKHPNYDMQSLVKRHSLSYANPGTVTSRFNFVDKNPKFTYSGVPKPMK